ncbi:MAG: hypothetical protein JWR09_2542 [Mucilaginibacter sp.]|nr:hypothetical protein [Mucilaginibacter sp.]
MVLCNNDYLGFGFSNSGNFTNLWNYKLTKNSIYTFICHNISNLSPTCYCNEILI